MSADADVTPTLTDAEVAAALEALGGTTCPVCTKAVERHTISEIASCISRKTFGPALVKSIFAPSPLLAALRRPR